MNFKQIGRAAITGALMLAGTAFTASPAQAQTRFSIGIGVNQGYVNQGYVNPGYVNPGYGYYAPPVVYRPAYPGPGYYWSDGYYDPYGRWTEGFWRPRAYIAPRVYGNGFYGGYRRVGRDDYRRYDRDDFRGRGNAYGRRR